MGKLALTVGVCGVIVASLMLGAIEVLARTSEQDELEPSDAD